MPADKLAPVREMGEECPKQHFKVVLLGSARVGKSSIISQFLFDKVISIIFNTSSLGLWPKWVDSVLNINVILRPMDQF